MAAGLSVNEVAALSGVSRSVVEKALEQGAIRAERRAGRSERLLPLHSVALAATFESLGRRLTVADKRHLSDTVARTRIEALAECRVEIAPALVVDVGRLSRDAMAHALRYTAARDAHLERRDDVMGGRPVIKGTRITASAVHGRLQGGDTLDDLLDDYPGVPREAFEAADLYARTHPGVGRPKADLASG